MAGSLCKTWPWRNTYLVNCRPAWNPPSPLDHWCLHSLHTTCILQLLALFIQLATHMGLVRGDIVSNKKQVLLCSETLQTASPVASGKILLIIIITMYSISHIQYLDCNKKFYLKLLCLLFPPQMSSNTPATPETGALHVKGIKEMILLTMVSSLLPLPRSSHWPLAPQVPVTNTVSSCKKLDAAEMRWRNMEWRAGKREEMKNREES